MRISGLMTNAYVEHPIVSMVADVVRQSRQIDGSKCCTMMRPGVAAIVMMAQQTNILKINFVALNCGTKRFDMMMFETRIKSVDAPKHQYAHSACA